MVKQPMEDEMTLFINPVRRVHRRQVLNELMKDMKEEYASECSFPMDVMADGDSFTIKALLPGVKPEDLDIQILNETVTISGKVEPEREEKRNYLLTELPDGKFYRVLTLPTQLNQQEVEAELQDGILTLRIPKAEEAKPKTIKVKVK
jgi:HSP20 family protein